MEERLLPVIYGRGLFSELKNIAPRPYLVVTMEDVWPIFASEFDDNACVHFVKSLEYQEILQDIEELPPFRSVIGLGGGQAVDFAKMAAWHENKPLYQAPTSLATNAIFGHRAGIRFDSTVRYIGYVEPQAIYVDYDVIQNGPKELNRSGVCDVFCYHNSVFDWKYASEHGKCEKKWPYDAEMAAKPTAVLQRLIENIDDVYELNEVGIRALAEGLRWGGAAFHNAGWNPRPIEGCDHFLFYTLEYMTKKKFIHGYPVCLGIYVGAMMQNNRPEYMLKLIHRMGIDIRPEAMGLTWDEVFAAMKYEREFLHKVGLWHSVAHDFEVTDEFCQTIQRNISAMYA